MKTAISLPDELFARAEELASRLGIARSRLYALALAEYVERHSSSSITHRLNAVYQQEDSALEDDLARLQAGAVISGDVAD